MNACLFAYITVFIVVLAIGYALFGLQDLL